MLHAKPSPLVSRKATPPNPLSHPSDAHPPKRQRVLTSKAAEWAATETGSASPLLTHFNASKPMAFPATKGNTETISVRQLVSYMPSTAETPSFLRCNACLQPATTLRHIAKTLGKKLREELSGVGTEWEWTPLERGEVVEHLRICEAGPLPPRKPKQVVVAPVVVEKQREEDSERDSVASDASRTEGRRIGRRKAVGASVALLKGKGAVAAAATLKKKEMEKRKRARSESTSEKDETPNFEVIIHDDPNFSLVLTHYPPYAPAARLRPSSILRSSNSISTFTSYLFFIPTLTGRIGVTLRSRVLRVPPTSVGILQGGKGSLVVRDGEVCWTMGRE